MKDDEILEKLSNKYLGNLPQEESPSGFSERVMMRIKEQPVNSSVFTYRPILSRNVWVVILVLWGISGFYYSGLEEFISEDFLSMDYFQYPELSLPNLSLPHLPDYLPGVMLVFSCMALVEILILKRIFDTKV